MSHSGFDLAGFHCKEEAEIQKMREDFLNRIAEDEKKVESSLERWRELGTTLPRTSAEMSPQVLYKIADCFLNVLLSRSELESKRNAWSNMNRR